MGEIASDETRYIADTGTVIVRRVHGDYSDPDCDDPEYWIGLSTRPGADDDPDVVIRLTDRQRLSLADELLEGAPSDIMARLRSWAATRQSG